MKTAKGVLEEVCGGVYVLMKATTNVSWDLTMGLFANAQFTTDLFQFDLSLLKDKTVEFVANVI